MSWQEKINAALDARRAADALRRRYPVAQGAGRWLVADDRQYLNFSSNDYLGLSHHPQIIRAWQQGAEQFGIGSTPRSERRVDFLLPAHSAAAL